MVPSTFPIVISTYNRTDNTQQKTFYQIPEVYWKEHVLVFSRESQATTLKKSNPGMNIITIPDSTDIGIARTRQTVLEHMKELGYSKYWMIDDSLRFHVRQPDTKLQTMKTEEEFHRMYEAVFSYTASYPMVSLAHRKYGAMRNGDGVRPSGIKEGHRAYANYTVDINLFEELGICFDGMWKKNNEIRLYEDFYVVLSLLSKGYKNVLLLDHAFEHTPGKPGGNSSIRTNDLQEKCAKALQQEFPNYVKLKQHDGKWGDLSEGRIDVQVNWKKLLQTGEETRFGINQDSLFD